MLFQPRLYGINTMTIPQIAINHHTFAFLNYPSEEAALAEYLVWTMQVSCLCCKICSSDLNKVMESEQQWKQQSL